MPILVFERKKSRDTTVSLDPGENELKLRFVAVGTDDDLALRAYLDDALPLFYGGCWRRDFRISYLGNYIWDVVSQFTRRAPNEPTLSWDIGGGTHHVSVSKETVSSFLVAGGGAAPDYMGSIGVDGQTVQGVDIHIPAVVWEETHYVPAELVTLQYLKDLGELYGLTNAEAAFNGAFEDGELLFLGGRVNSRGTDFYEVVYRFGFSPNRDDLEIPGVAQPFAKKGWEYVWVRFTDVVDPAGGAPALVRRPHAVYVERVYDPGDYTVLGDWVGSTLPG